MDEPDHPTPLEQSRLLYIYQRLCNFSDKHPLEQQIKELTKEKNQAEQDIKKAKEAYDARAKSKKTEAFSKPKDAAKKLKESEALLKEKEAQLKYFRAHSVSGAAVIGDKDIAKALKVLQIKKLTKRELETLIWEVDEDLDGKINWRDFQLMFNRNLTDKIGLEPATLFNLIQFMIYDKNENAHVSVDETMLMLYARFGRARMEEKLKELFGDALKETGKEGGEINFSQYLDVVNRLQKQKFWGSTIGELVLTSSSTPPSQKKMAKEFIKATV